MLMCFNLRWLNVSTVSLKLRYALIATISTVAISLPARSVDLITFNYPPLGDFSISVKDLDAFANEGKITPDLAFYTKRIKPKQLKQIQNLLKQRFEFSPVTVSEITYSSQGEQLLERIGKLVQTDSRENGMKSLRSALILAAADKTEGLTVVNVLHRFPGQQLHLKLTEGLSVVSNFSELLKSQKTVMTSLKQITNTEPATDAINFSSKLDLRQSGSFHWQKRRFEWMDHARHRLVPGDLYLPQAIAANSVPLIVISHGAAEDRTTFAYLAEHLASHGFAVAALEHMGSDANRFRQTFSGLASAPIATELLDRPRDVSFLLDELQRQAQSDPTLQQLNLQQVGLIGHSLGGYTALALAGAAIDFGQIKRDCNPNRSLNLSVVLQCRANEFKPDRYSLRDSRIRAIFAINPLDSTIFGKWGMSQVRVPVLLMGGSDDIVTPAVPEQIYPFTWLQAPDKYLAILEKGTHFSTLAVAKDDQVISVPKSLIGPNPAIAQTYTKALTVAFFQTYLADRSEFRPYLTAAYANSISQVPMQLNLFQSSATDKIAQILQEGSELP